jgi:hypothetical protein
MPAALIGKFLTISIGQHISSTASTLISLVVFCVVISVSMWRSTSTFLLKPLNVVFKIPEKGVSIPIYGIDSAVLAGTWLVDSLNDQDIIMVRRNIIPGWPVIHKHKTILSARLNSRVTILWAISWQ